MATHYSILAWKISWTEEPGRLQSMGSQRVGHSWVTNSFTLFIYLVYLSFNDLKEWSTNVLHMFIRRSGNQCELLKVIKGCLCLKRSKPKYMFLLCRLWQVNVSKNIPLISFWHLLFFTMWATRKAPRISVKVIT